MDIVDFFHFSFIIVFALCWSIVFHIRHFVFRPAFWPKGFHVYCLFIFPFFYFGFLFPFLHILANVVNLICHKWIFKPFCFNTNLWGRAVFLLHRIYSFYISLLAVFDWSFFSKENKFIVIVSDFWEDVIYLWPAIEDTIRVVL